jgi:hypothetical protein
MRNGIKLCKENGVELLGGGVSRHGDFFTSFTFNKIDSAIQSIKNTMNLEDDQICMRLLDNTNGTNIVNHLYRYIHPTHFGNATEKLRSVLKSS